MYLLYAHARIASIVRKAESSKGVDVNSLKEKHSIQASISAAGFAPGVQKLLFAACKVGLCDGRSGRITCKTGFLNGKYLKSLMLQLLHPAEVALGLHIVRLPEAVEDMLEELYPNKITDFVYELSDKFSSFYTECQVRLSARFGRIVRCL